MDSHRQINLHLTQHLACVAAVWFLPAAVSPVIAQCQLQKLLASEGTANDRFGRAVAIDADLLILGASGDFGNEFLSGSAYIFRANRSSWTEETRLIASDGEASDYFGGSVAVSGDVVIVGAPSDDGPPPGQNFGSAYVYRFDPKTSAWDETKLTAADGAHMDHFARSVAINGDVAIAGSHGDDDNGTGSGSAYIFRYDPDTSAWAQETKLLASDGAEGDRFGASVAMSGQLALVGASEDGDNGMYSGSAYVFRYDPDTSAWIEEAKLLASDGAALDWFGRSVAISGDHLIVGAAEFYSGRPGKAYIYHFDGSKWIEQTTLRAVDGALEDHFGEVVAIEDGMAIVGVRMDDDNGEDSGSAYVYRFDLDTSMWVEQAKLLASDGSAGDQFGDAVAVGNGQVIVGAPFDQDNGPDSGSAYIFDLGVCSRCAWDLDGDSSVGILDLLELLAAWGADPGDPPDFDGDGTVGILDLLTLLANWGPCV
ncbi:MAG: hypothetical protein IH889_05325 [Planctomycetes bacterium]|nr:hypothetical protein [Planctomycetota bacterium]